MEAAPLGERSQGILGFSDSKIFFEENKSIFLSTYEVKSMKFRR